MFFGRDDNSNRVGHGILANLFELCRNGFKPDLPNLMGSSGCYMTQHENSYCCSPMCKFYTKCSEGYYK